MQSALTQLSGIKMFCVVKTLFMVLMNQNKVLTFYQLAASGA